MGEIRIVDPGKTSGFLYPVCKKRIYFLEPPGKNKNMVSRKNINIYVTVKNK